MFVKEVRDEDFTNYKKPCMVIGFPTCTWKCGKGLCQNSPLATSPSIEISPEALVKRYINNPITSAVVCAGLEPFDSWCDLYAFVKKFRENSNDDLIVFTGYTHEEVREKVDKLVKLGPIIVKFGRYIPNQEPHFDEILGIKLASSNQYAESFN